MINKASLVVLRGSVFVVFIYYVACAKQLVPQWRGNTKVAIGVVVMDVMIGRPVSGKNIMKTVVVNGEMTQPIGNVV